MPYSKNSKYSFKKGGKPFENDDEYSTFVA